MNCSFISQFWTEGVIDPNPGGNQSRWPSIVWEIELTTEFTFAPGSPIPVSPCNPGGPGKPRSPCDSNHYKQVNTKEHWSLLYVTTRHKGTCSEPRQNAEGTGGESCNSVSPWDQTALYTVVKYYIQLKWPPTWMLLDIDIILLIETLIYDNLFS